MKLNELGTDIGEASIASIASRFITLTLNMVNFKNYSPV